MLNLILMCPHFKLSKYKHGSLQHQQENQNINTQKKIVEALRRSSATTSAGASLTKTWRVWTKECKGRLRQTLWQSFWKPKSRWADPRADMENFGKALVIELHIGVGQRFGEACVETSVDILNNQRKTKDYIQFKCTIG